MIERHELRVGNLISITDPPMFNGSIKKVLEILNKEVIYSSHLTQEKGEKIEKISEGEQRGHSIFKDIYAVPLTIEILEKAGFYQRAKYFHSNGGWLIKLENGVFEVYGHKTGIVKTDPVYFLHELQNLYFDQNGKNLDIQL